MDSGGLLHTAQMSPLISLLPPPPGSGDARCDLPEGKGQSLSLLGGNGGRGGDGLDKAWLNWRRRTTRLLRQHECQTFASEPPLGANLRGSRKSHNPKTLHTMGPIGG